MVIKGTTPSTISLGCVFCLVKVGVILINKISAVRMTYKSKSAFKIRNSRNCFSLLELYPSQLRLRKVGF